jgi:gamma-glutamyltranspeptidase / glutathione hydrolase
MVSAANPYAVEAGLDVLRRGGSAVDAAVAVQMVLGFVEPAESGIGGGGFLLHLEARTGEMQVYDGRETAPASAHPGRFLLPGGIPMPKWMAVVSGRSVGVPGLAAMLRLAHDRHGVLPWNELIEPAAMLAEQGVPMPPHLRSQVARDPSLWLFSGVRRHFVRPSRAADPILVNVDLARTYRRLADEGPKTLHSGSTASLIVEAANGMVMGAGLSSEDLESYVPVVREPVCGTYRRWSVCGPPPPSGGGLGVLRMLEEIEATDLAEIAPNSIQAIRTLADAGIAEHARRHQIGDPDFKQSQAKEQAEPFISFQVPEALTSGTTHFSIVDGQGNVVSMTSSIEAPFGSRIMVDGFVLNNQLTDFDFRPQANSAPSANAVGPGKRPRSSMSPTIVLDGHGRVRLVIGARGGERIVGHVVKTIVGVLDWGLSVQEAIALPNVVGLSGRIELEQGTVLETLADGLRDSGHQVDIRALPSGLHGIERVDQGWRGGADPRLDGIARGD